ASMHDLALALQWVRDDQGRSPGSDSFASVAPARRRSRLTIAVVGLTAAVLGALVSWVAQRPGTTSSPTLMRAELSPSPADPINVGTTSAPLAISRDGRRLAYTS